jgi:hypothetical protein
MIVIVLIGWAILCGMSSARHKDPWTRFAQALWAFGFMIAATLVEVL